MNTPKSDYEHSWYTEEPHEDTGVDINKACVTCDKTNCHMKILVESTALGNRFVSNGDITREDIRARGFTISSPWELEFTFYACEKCSIPYVAVCELCSSYMVDHGIRVESRSIESEHGILSGTEPNYVEICRVCMDEEDMHMFIETFCPSQYMNPKYNKHMNWTEWREASFEETPRDNYNYKALHIARDVSHMESNATVNAERLRNARLGRVVPGTVFHIKSGQELAVLRESTAKRLRRTFRRKLQARQVTTMDDMVNAALDALDEARPFMLHHYSQAFSPPSQ